MPDGVAVVNLLLGVGEDRLEDVNLQDAVVCSVPIGRLVEFPFRPFPQECSGEVAVLCL